MKLRSPGAGVEVSSPRNARWKPETLGRTPGRTVERLRSVDARLALLPIMVVGAIVRFDGIGSKSIWQDEAFSIRMAKLSPPDMIAQLRDLDLHPPLYYLLLHYWIDLVGDSEAAVRSLSALVGLATVLAIYKIGSLLSGRSVGLLASLLVSLSAMDVWYSRTARMYALLALLTVLSFHFLVRLARNERGLGTVSAYLVASVALIYTHAYGLFVLAAQSVFVLFGLWVSRAPGRLKELRRWVVLQLGILVAYIPWIIVWISIFGRDINGERCAGTCRKPTGQDLQNMIELFPGGPALLLVLIGTGLAVLAGGSVSRGQALFRRVDWPSLKRDFRLPLLSAWLIVPVAVPFALSFLVTPMFEYHRHPIVAAMAFCVVVAIVWSRIRSVLLFTVLGIAIVTGSLHYVRASNSWFETEDWRTATRYVEARAVRGDLLLFNESYARDAYNYYSKRPSLSRAFIAKLRVEHEKRYPEVRARAEGHERVWMMAPLSREGLAATAVAKRELRGGFVVRLQRSSGSLGVTLFEQRGTSR